MTATLTRFSERTTGAATIQRVDRAAGILHGVKILGEHSKNGRRYLPQAMRDAVPLYEGSQFYVDHPKREKLNDDRPCRECAGVFFGVHYREGAGLFANLKLRKQSPSFAEILEIAEDFPESFGMSHVADGKSRREGGVEVVYEIREVFSVDLVTSPATTAGLFESVGITATSPLTIGTIHDAITRLSPLITQSMRSVYLKGRGSFPAEQTSLLIQVVEGAAHWAERNATNSAHAAWVSRCMLESARNIIDAASSADKRESAAIAAAELDLLKLTIEALHEGKPAGEAARFSEHVRKFNAALKN